ncbi:heptaprenyl diphosphate synthase component 1 (plasmid) [Bacillus sp. 31A1R]|uniref:Heptaprenyl diphosphate synthase component 1 n=1 Tax=Robertmurraya mangrovi TaxID=3098077 RepID=A0ABU5IVM8_9BACI|nr:heptaprenyl diphosphate synthase component 1 [Bacillus sp. 31A1R]MDZ5471200.1 heptaprenyl diphosphate synthase component 1 [Bacillus sp. 31A1R]
MIILEDIQKKIADLKEKIQEQLMHPYLLSNIQAPVIDEDKLLILISILDQVDLPIKTYDNYVLTTMLLHVAIDTHEQVTNSIPDEDALKTRQLTVLAGVYYSGLYYKFLAAEDDVDVIRMLAEGIKEIYDKKILVYQKSLDSQEKLMTSLMAIESSLIDKFINYFKLDSWNELASNFLLIKRLSKEMEQFKQSGKSVVFEALKQLTLPNVPTLKDLSLEQQNHLILICEKYMDYARDLLEKAIVKLPHLNANLNQRISTLLQQPSLMRKEVK